MVEDHEGREAADHRGQRTARLALGLVLLLAALIRALYLAHTPPQARCHDYRGHISYVQFIASTGLLPEPESCFECWQPPLYYYVAAAVYSCAKKAGVNPERALQLFSVLMFFGFIVAAAGILRLVCSKQWQIVLGTAVVALWPSGVLHSARIGNEVMLYFLWSFGLLFLCRWYTFCKRSDFLLTGFFALLSTVAKATGLVLFVAFIVSIIFRQLSRKAPVLRLHLIDVALVVTMMLGGSFVTFVRPPFHGTGGDWLIGNVHALVPEIQVENGLENYVRFNPYRFVDEPFINVLSGQSRNDLPHYFLKSSLFGEYSFSVRSVGLARSLSVLLLLLLSYLVLSFGWFSWSRCGQLTPLFASLILLGCAFVFVRYRLPTSANSDFRFILPVLLSVAPFLVEEIQTHWQQGRRWAGRLGVLIVGAFLANAVVFWFFALA